VKLKEEHPEIVQCGAQGQTVRDVETGRVGEGALLRLRRQRGCGLREEF
jgi:hypothetical protein